jgi:hypothetical protein
MFTCLSLQRLLNAHDYTLERRKTDYIAGTRHLSLNTLDRHFH